MTCNDDLGFGKGDSWHGQLIFNPHKPISNTVSEQLKQLCRRGTLGHCMGGRNVGDNIFFLVSFTFLFDIFSLVKGNYYTNLF